MEAGEERMKEYMVYKNRRGEERDGVRKGVRKGMGNEQEQGRKDAEGRMEGRWAGTKYTGINVQKDHSKVYYFSFYL